ncbi:tetratricopeptide repeat protein [Niabella hibiscisoli]|uniref:tetratricopeptide repeat protein n=1 Tax=Niabella hibiscisoli TaxID=1825928 RepID=UPI00374C94EA
MSAAPNATSILRSGAHYNVGVVYSNQNKIEESVEAYKRALRLNSQDKDARENLQKALSELKKSGGGGGGEDKPQQAPSKLNKSQAQQQLDRLEQKRKIRSVKYPTKNTIWRQRWKRLVTKKECPKTLFLLYIKLILLYGRFNCLPGQQHPFRSLLLPHGHYF